MKMTTKYRLPGFRGNRFLNYPAVLNLGDPLLAYYLVSLERVLGCCEGRRQIDHRGEPLLGDSFQCPKLSKYAARFLLTALLISVAICSSDRTSR
jgi:hypothetical protein